MSGYSPDQAQMPNPDRDWPAEPPDFEDDNTGDHFETDGPHAPDCKVWIGELCDCVSGRYEE